jgi:hypothetical protein
MTIKAWVMSAGSSVQLATASEGIYTALGQGQISNTVSLAGATLAPTDLIQVQTNTGACAIKVLGGQDTGFGPCTIGDDMTIANHSGQNLTIYPNNASGKVKNQGAGVGYLIATGLTAFLVYLGSDNWALNAS